MIKFSISLQNKLNILTIELKEQDSFSVSDAVAALEMKVATVRWILWNLTDLGKIKRIGQGLYTFNLQEKQPAPPQLSTLAKKTREILVEQGIYFFISGLDILAGYMTHIPERYPVITFGEQTNIEEIQELLSEKKINSIIRAKVEDFRKIRHLPSLGEIVILRPTKEFGYSHEGLAEPEKAFLDLYYEVTRASYPLSLRELGRIFLNMKRRGSINEKRLSKVAIRRNLHHDIRFILNYKRISKFASDFSEILMNLEKE